MSAPSVDPELENVAWDLDPLLDGGADDPDAAVDGDARRGAAPRGRVRAGVRGQGRRARRRRPDRRDARARGDPGGARPRGLLRDAQLRRQHRRPAARRAAAEGRRRARPRSRRRCCSSSSSGRRSTTTRPTSSLATDGLDFARHHLRTARRYRPHLLSEPEEKILAEKALTGRSAWSRLFEEQTSAITVELAGRVRAGLARGRAVAAVRARPRDPPQTPPSA